MSFLDDVRAALISRCPALLMDWLPDGRLEGNYYVCGSLAGGSGDSLKVNLRRGLWRDWAEPSQRDGDLISLYAAVKAIRYKDALYALSDQCGVPRPSPASRSRDWQVVQPIPPDAYRCAEDGKPLLPNAPCVTGFSAYWTYFDAEGRLLCFRVRWDKPDGGKDVKPLAFCRHRLTGETSWQLRDLPWPLPLYNLLGLTCEPQKLLLVEGEKVADAVGRLLPDWCVTTWPGGSKRVRYADWTPIRRLTGCRIVLWPDNDSPGIAAMSEVSRILERPLEVVRLDPGWPKSYDIADLERDGWNGERLERWIADNAIRVTPAPAETRPEVDVTGQDLFIQMQAVYEAMREIKAEIYHSSGGLVYVRRNIYGLPELCGMQAQQFQAWSARHLDSFHYSGNGKSRCPISDRLALAVVFNAPDSIPVLRRFSDIPMFSSGGELLDRAGYHPETQVYLNLPEGFDPAMPLEQAWQLIDDLLHDFPFETESDRAAAVAYPLTAICRDLIDGPTPLFRFEAPAPRTGKSLLCRALSEIITSYPGECTLPETEEETKKVLTTRLMLTPAVIVFDNCYKLEHASLKSVLTSDIWEDRLLGLNRDVKIPIRNLWAATLNNPLLSQEMFGRSVRVRLNAKVEHPEVRTGWRHDPIMSYVRENRGALVSAFVAIAQNGLGENITLPICLGGYESWIRVLAPILEFNSFGGFLGTVEEDRKLCADAEADALHEFVETWKEHYGKNEVRTSVLVDLAASIEGLPIRRGKDGKLTPAMLGKYIQKRRGYVVAGATIFGPIRVMGGSVCYLKGDFESPIPDERLPYKDPSEF